MNFQEDLTKRFNNAILKPLLLDGAIGSYLQEKINKSDEVLWMTNVNRNIPEVVIQLHKDYIEAGADIITTNTFRTNPAALEEKNIFNFSSYVKEAVELAKKAVDGMKILIAGSNPPAEDCYQSERTISYSKLEMNHKYHIDLLMDNKVDFVLNETQNHFDEIKIICNHCDRNSIPYVVSLYVQENLQILSGEKLEYILSFLRDHNVLAIGFNCISPELFLKIIGSIQLPDRWGFYLNCGSGKPTDKKIKCGVSADNYLKYVKKALHLKPAFIGSCCGSDPSHIKKIRELLDGKNDS
jgi:homocysteine S-methyltransferase